MRTKPLTNFMVICNKQEQSNVREISLSKLMCHGISNNFFFNFLKKNRTIEMIVNYCCCEKIINKGSFILTQQHAVSKHHQDFSLKQLRNQMSFGNEISKDAYFYEMLRLKTNWNLNKAHLKTTCIHLH